MLKDNAARALMNIRLARALRVRGTRDDFKGEASYRELDVPRFPAKPLKSNVIGIVLVLVWICEDSILSDVSLEAISPASAILVVEGLLDAVRFW
jgi:hypothetical protein